MMSEYLVGGAAGGALIGMWQWIKNLLIQIRSLFIVKIVFDVNFHKAFKAYSKKHLKQIKIGDRHFNLFWLFVKTIGKHWIGAEEFPKSQGVFFKGWCPLFFGSNTSGSGERNSGTTLSISFIKWTFNIDKLVGEITNFMNESENSIEIKNFFIRHMFGNYGEGGINGDNIAKISPEHPVDSIDDPVYLAGLRFIDHSLDEIGEERFGKKSPFIYLAYPQNVINDIDDIKRWKKSKDWYKSKGIPWKRGWLLCGKAGTGKTSLVRAIAEDIGMPVFVFHLASFQDRDLMEKWENMCEQAPCIALIEDIDAIFHGRDNISQKGMMGSQPLSFDALLNVIDGIRGSDGVFTIVTTNHPEFLDSALAIRNGGGRASRPGRIDRIIELEVLDQDCRRRIAERIICDIPDLVANTVAEGEGETGAQFQERCAKIALEHYWSVQNKKEII
jgi:hypothetical protein